MKINDLLIKSTKKLCKKNISSASLDAEILLSFALKKSREFLFAYPKKELNEAQLKKFNLLLKRRLKLEPTAYLIQNKEFFGLNFYVDKKVLIPRPETESLIAEILKYAKEKQQATCHMPQATRHAPRATRHAPHKPRAICDIGTGSGCIAITLARYLPQTKIIAADISQEALKTARKNARLHKVQKRIKFLKGSLLDPLKKPVDIIVANLPYLETKEIKKGLKFEPALALNGGKKGLILIEKILSQAPKYLKPNGRIFLEISSNQAKAVQNLAQKYLPNKKIFFIRDLAGRKRVAVVG